MFALTATGLDVLQKVDRGLHRPAWMSESKANALRRLVDGVCMRQILFKKYGISGSTITSLLKAGYITHPHGSTNDLAVTDLGREALRDYEEDIS